MHAWVTRVFPVPGPPQADFNLRAAALVSELVPRGLHSFLLHCLRSCHGGSYSALEASLCGTPPQSRHF
eukprot:10234917-Prorocentrum_lima.AAC.1